ncbi:hypothetical protein SELMODRAFT_402276 [Selaginella moellendorffii]|uniref:Uncharacterized protein n=1 Tax=Selaginella moellendorffii TaxID=88036 RepID=D8QQ50_SELML|nr:hypothetical protein SELMODRAFT_402276 [Selaginella moellendorffii]
MVNPDLGVSMQEPDGSREPGNAKASYSIGEAVGGSAIGGGAELGGRNEAPSAIGGGADLGGGNGRYAVAPEGHRNEVVTMLEADTILNERVCETIVQAQEQTINRVLGEMAWKGSQHLEIPLCHLKQSHWVPMDFLVAVWAKPIVKAKQNSYLKITQVTDEVQKNLELRQIEQRILNSKKSKFEILVLAGNGKAPEELIYNIAKKALLEGVEMPQDRDEIHIEQTKDERVENLAKNSPTPSHPTAVAHSLDPTAATYVGETSQHSICDVRPLSPTGSVGNVEIVIEDYFQLSNNVSRESSMFHRWMRGLGMNNTFGIDLAFFDLSDGLPPLQGDTPSWNILRLDYISQAVDVASKVLRYEGIMLIILPRSLFWGGLLATMVENDDSRLVEFASGCLFLNMPIKTKGAGFSMELPCSLPLLLPS